METVPAAPFRAIAERRLSRLTSDPSVNSPTATLAEQAKLPVRFVYRLLNEEQENISFDNADKIVTHLIGPMSWWTHDELREIYTSVDLGQNVEPEVEHGKRSTYNKHKCRCEACCAANRTYLQSYKRKPRTYRKVAA